MVYFFFRIQQLWSNRTPGVRIRKPGYSYSKLYLADNKRLIKTACFMEDVYPVIIKNRVYDKELFKDSVA